MEAAAVTTVETTATVPSTSASHMSSPMTTATVSISGTRKR
jgi:hypothetical protein